MIHHFSHRWLPVAAFVAVTAVGLDAQTPASRTCGIQEQIDALPRTGLAVGGVVRIDGGCTFSTPITINAAGPAQHGITLAGDTPTRAVLRYTGTGAAIQIGRLGQDTLHVELRNLSIGTYSPFATAVRAIRTKHLVLEALLLDGTNGGDRAIMLDGGDQYSAFTRILYPRIVGAFNTGIEFRGAGAGRYSNNANLVIGGTITRVGAGVGVGIDAVSGDTLTISATDVENWAVGTRLATERNMVTGRYENNGTDLVLTPTALDNTIGGSYFRVLDQGLRTTYLKRPAY